MMKIRVFPGAADDVQSLRQLAQHPFMAQVSLNRRRDAKAGIFILGGESPPLVDHQFADVVLGLEQVHATHPTQDQMVDLRDLAIDHKAQVMQQHIVFSTAEVAIHVVRRLALALDVFLGARQFFAQPFFLAQIQRSDLSSAELSAIGSFWKRSFEGLNSPILNQQL